MGWQNVEELWIILLKIYFYRLFYCLKSIKVVYLHPNSFTLFITKTTMKKTFFVGSLMMALLMGTSTLVSCDKDESINPSSTGGNSGKELEKATKETVTWNFQVKDLQLAQEMGLKLAYYDANGAVKTADVSNLTSDGKFSVQVVADATKDFKMAFVAVWYLTKPAAEYTAASYNFESTITPTIVRTFPSGDKTISVGTAQPYIQTGTLKAQTKESLQKRINAGYNYVETSFAYSYSDGSVSSISKDDLLQALGAVKNGNK